MPHHLIQLGLSVPNKKSLLLSKRKIIATEESLITRIFDAYEPQYKPIRSNQSEKEQAHQCPTVLGRNTSRSIDTWEIKPASQYERTRQAKRDKKLPAQTGGFYGRGNEQSNSRE